jgi:hypothetical protein
MPEEKKENDFENETGHTLTKLEVPMPEAKEIFRNLKTPDDLHKEDKSEEKKK